MYTSFHKTKVRQVIYNLKTHKILVYVTATLLVLALALLRLWGPAASAGAGEEPVPPALRRYVRHGNAALPHAALSQERSRELRARLALLNDNCTDLDSRAQPPCDDDTLIVVQVHRDLVRLQYLIVSLAQVRGIERALLVFSHGYYDERIDELVRSITFCEVRQIYFPHSPQLHPGAFPGEVGGARDAERVQHKQHWWWKAHVVFSRLQWSGMVLLLEEHDRVAPDTLHLLSFAQRAFAYHPEAQVVSLGGARGTGVAEYALLMLEAWRGAHGVGLALNRTAWWRIVAQTERFCLFDDVEWSYSLQHLFAAWSGGAADALVAVAARVVAAAGAWRDAALFPEAVRVVAAWGPVGRLRAVPPEVRGAGGWADPRDHRLCLDPLLSDAETDAGTDATVYHSRLAL